MLLLNINWWIMWYWDYLISIHLMLLLNAVDMANRMGVSPNFNTSYVVIKQ